MISSRALLTTAHLRFRLFVVGACWRWWMPLVSAKTCARRKKKTQTRFSENNLAKEEGHGSVAYGNMLPSMHHSGRAHPDGVAFKGGKTHITVSTHIDPNSSGLLGTNGSHPASVQLQNKQANPRERTTTRRTCGVWVLCARTSSRLQWQSCSCCVGLLGRMACPVPAGAVVLRCFYHSEFVKSVEMCLRN